MGINDGDLLVMEDFYSAGLAAAELAERGHVDAAEDILRHNLARVADPKYEAKANDLLARLDAPVSDEDTRRYQIKRCSLEFMLVDRDMPDAQKGTFAKRYSKRSVKRLALVMERPRVGAGIEYLDDIISGMKNLPSSGRKALWFVGDSAIRGMMYGLLGVTGNRKADEYMKRSDLSDGKGICTYVSMGISKFISTFLAGIGLGSAMLSLWGFGSEEHSLLEEAGWAAGGILLGSIVYEIGRAVKRAYDEQPEKRLRLSGGPKRLVRSQVDVRVELDDAENDIPVYLDINGKEERVYASTKKVSK